MIRTRGFSLVELSIVLVILGLLTGGILAGQSLIRASELRSISTQYQTYVTAVQSFRDKYQALPGDMRNATSFWGALHATPATCYAMASSSALTCNGDGNGVVATQGSGADTAYERFRFWQHLANGGLLEGQYTGYTGPGGSMVDSIPGLNVPRGRIGNSGWVVGTVSAVPGASTLVYSIIYGQFLLFGATATNTETNGALLKPEEVWNIDTKLDDGRPARGKIIVRFWDQCTTSASETDLAGEYLLTETGNLCSMYFTSVF